MGKVTCYKSQFSVPQYKTIKIRRVLCNGVVLLKLKSRLRFVNLFMIQQSLLCESQRGWYVKSRCIEQCPQKKLLSLSTDILTVSSLLVPGVPVSSNYNETILLFVQRAILQNCCWPTVASNSPKHDDSKVNKKLPLSHCKKTH